jgi:lysophospholipase L1-like esterase
MTNFAPDARKAAQAASSTMEPLEGRTLLSVPDVAGTWSVTENVTYTARLGGQSDSGRQSGSHDVVLHQQGSTVWYSIPWDAAGRNGTLTRRGTIRGNAVTFTGPFVVLAPGVRATTNTVTIRGTLSGNTIRLGGAGHVAGQARGQSFTIDGKSTAVFKRPRVPLTAKFTWRMPDRYGVDAAGERVKSGWDFVLRNSPAYANPASFTLALDGGATQTTLPVKRYEWSVAGNGLATPRTASGKAPSIARLAPGRYVVTLRVTLTNGQVDAVKQNVTLRDFLIVAIGDSYSSGEGNPVVRKDAAGAAQWADGVTLAMTRQNREAHRSTLAASSQAALAIERADPHTSVTFVMLSQSGATVDEGLLGPKEGSETKTYPLGAQVDQLASVVGDRPIDVLTVSIGGNDVRFVDRTVDLIIGPQATGVGTEVETREQMLERLRSALDFDLSILPARYLTLRNVLEDRFEIAHTIITEYPDPTRDADGQFAPFLGVPRFEELLGVDAEEARFAYERMLVPLNEIVRTAADAYGWLYAGGIADAFREHGYPSANRWFVTFGESGDRQGGWEGALHPSTTGHGQIAGLLLKYMSPAIADLRRAASGG